MNENTGNEIIGLLKDYCKSLLGDSIKVILFFSVFGVVANFIYDNSLLEDGFFLELALYIIFASAILRGIFLVLGILIILSKNKKGTSKLSEEDLNSINADYAENLKHYKDVFKLGSPMITKYVNDPTSKSMDENVLVAALAHLIRKGKIRIEGSELVVINRDVSLECEKYLLSKIREGKFCMGTESSFYPTLSTYVAKDAVDQMNLLEKAKPKSKWRGKLILLGFILCFFLGAFTDEDSLAYLIFECGAMCFMIYGFVYASSLSKLKTTKRGEEINKKIEGLKKYLLKNYEVLSKSNDPEFEAPYILHMIAFGYNPKMVEMYMKYVDITPEPGE